MIRTPVIIITFISQFLVKLSSNSKYSHALSVTVMIKLKIRLDDDKLANHGGSMLSNAHLKFD